MFKSAEHENSKSYLINPKHFAKVFVVSKVFFSSKFLSKQIMLCILLSISTVVFSVIRRDCIFPKLLRILKIVLRYHDNLDTKRIFSFENNLKDLDPSNKMDLDFWIVLKEKHRLISYN